MKKRRERGKKRKEKQKEENKKRCKISEEWEKYGGERREGKKSREN